MKYLKTLSIISFLLINGLGEHGIPNFASIFLGIYQFITDIITLPHNHEISWSLGLYSISVISCLLIILLAKKYRGRYLLMISVLILFVAAIYASGILYHQKTTFWFIFPFTVFILSSVILIIMNFQKPKDTIPPN